MTPEDRRTALEAFTTLGAGNDDEPSDPLATFLPIGPQRRALRPETVVVLGSRGMGKTALFRLVNDPRTAPRLQGFFDDPGIRQATWFDAFSRADRHPGAAAIEALAPSVSDLGLRAFWMTYLLRRLRDEVPDAVNVPPEIEPLLTAPAADLGAWVPGAEAGIRTIFAALEAAHRALEAADRRVVATYDGLDRIAPFDREIRRRILGTLLALWLQLGSRYQRLRGKVFLRQDLLDAKELGIADPIVLKNSTVTLTWDPATLYRLVARRLAAKSEAAREWLRQVPGLELVDRGELGWMPGDMSSTEVQGAFVARFGGLVIGRGIMKGATSEWIAGRLRDAHKRITPRAMLRFFAFAADEALGRPVLEKGPLVEVPDLIAAVRRTSRERAEELREEEPVMLRMENLRGMTLWIPRDEALSRLGTPHPQEPAGLPTRAEVILAELIRLGVLREREEAEIDVPDIYRYAFEITPDFLTAWRDLFIW